MRRKILVSSIAAALAAPFAAYGDEDLSAEDAKNKFQIGAFEVSVGGEANLSADLIDTGSDTDTAAGEFPDGTEDATNIGFRSNFSEVVVGASVQLAPELEAFLELNSEVALDGDAGGDFFFGSRDSFIGMRGPSWGQMRYGVIDTPYEDSDDELEDDNPGLSAMGVQPLPDGISDWKAIIHSLPGGPGDEGSDDVFDVRAINAFDYVTPRVHGVNVRGMVSANGSKEDTINDAFQPDFLFDNGVDNNDFWSWAVSVSFALGPVGIVYAHERQHWDEFEGFRQSFTGAPQFQPGGALEDGVLFDSPRAHTVYAVYGTEFGTKLRAAWERIDMDDELGIFERDHAVFASVEQQLGRLPQTPHVLRRASVFVNWAYADDFDGVDESGATFLAGGIKYNFSEDAQVYLEGAWTDNDDNATYSFDQHAGVSGPGEDVIGASLGVKYAF